MNWGKAILIFQAIVTLIIGFVFLMQTLTLEDGKIVELKISLNVNQADEDIFPEFEETKTRYTTAFYILILISIMELIIVSKLLT